MTSQLSPVPVAKFFDNNGAPLAFGLLTTYAAGTTTPQATYVDSTQTTQNTNPIQLNFRGECNLWLDPTKTYKFLLQDLFGNTIPGWPVDNIPGSAFVSASGSITIPANLIPTPTNTLTLGNPSFSWAQIYLGANAVPAFDPVSGNIGYYARTAAEIAALVTPTNFSYLPLDIRRYGGDPTGVSTSDAALVNAIAVLASTGGTIRCPNAGISGGANYVFNNQISLSVKNGILIEGDGVGDSGVNPGTRFTYTGTATPFINMNSSQDVRLRKIQIVHSNAGFTGFYVQCNNDGTHGDPSGCGLDDCTVGASVSNTSHLDLNKCTNFSCTHTVFQYYGSSGSVQGAQVGGYANNISFSNSCEWFNGAGSAIQNAGPHQGWTFIDCTFEGLILIPNKPAGAIASTANTGTWEGLAIFGCWFGDVGTATGTWIDIYPEGFAFHGNYISGNATGTTALSLRQAFAVSIQGNFFDTFLNAINFATAPCADIVVKGNIVGSVTNPWVNSTNVTIATLDFGPNFGFGIPSGHGALGTNGLSVNPTDGSIEIWGLASVTTASGTFSFPAIGGVTGFPNNNFNVECTLSGVGSTANTIYPSSLTKTGFGYTIGGAFTNPTTFYYRAKGN